jgi:glycosyltransferase involved in cell wall biosynthesis
MTTTSEVGPLRVLLVHNAYQMRGGEDSVVDAEVSLLRARGHEVTLFQRSNDDINNMSRLGVASQTMWSVPTTRQVGDAIARHRPDVVHVHNTHPLVSPSVFWAAQSHGVPTVMTLHNFRLLCPQATLLRAGRPCEDCVGRAPWAALQHRCYRSSVVQTGALAATLMLHRMLGTYQHKVSRFIALNEFCKTKFVAGGLPADRIAIKPNFVDCPALPVDQVRSGGLYVGRLSEEKGIHVLLKALCAYPEHQVEILGSGPCERDAQEVAGAAYKGAQSPDQVMVRLAKAAYLVLPSICYEGFPRTLVEAFASGAPVIASRHGSLAELVEDGVTGLLFTPGDVDDLVAKMRWADNHPEAMLAMGQSARKAYEMRYSPARNYDMLMGIYAEAGAVTAQG